MSRRGLDSRHGQMNIFRGVHFYLKGEGEGGHFGSSHFLIAAQALLNASATR
jgi:hypothetical protein